MTVEELVDAIGKGEKWIRFKIKALLVSGHLELVSRREKNIAGIVCPKPAYRLKK